MTIPELNGSRNNTFGGAFHQVSPFFFTQEGATLSLVGTFKGASAFLIASGPSFLNVEPSKLDSVWTMTLNNAITTYRSNANCTVDTPSRFNYSMWLDPKIQKFVPMASFDEPLWDNRLLTLDGKPAQQWQRASLTLGECPNVVGFRRNDIFNANRFLYESTFNWGCSKKHGGCRSVMLPALRILFLLGFRNVYLLGVDFEMNSEKKYHFSEQRTKSAIRGNMGTFNKLTHWFKELQPYFLGEGFMVHNCNPTSKLEVFPYIDLDNAINNATLILGNHKKEESHGMYIKLEGKVSKTSPKILQRSR